MQVRRTEITTQVDRGDAYGYRVRFQGAAGESITVSFRSDRWLDDDDEVKRQAMAMMSDTVSTPGPLNAYDALSNGNIPSEVEMAEQARSGETEEEDDDNAYQESDEALPNDTEEAVINRDPSREGGRFDET